MQGSPTEDRGLRQPAQGAGWDEGPSTGCSTGYNGACTGRGGSCDAERRRHNWGDYRGPSRMGSSAGNSEGVGGGGGGRGKARGSHRGEQALGESAGWVGKASQAEGRSAGCSSSYNGGCEERGHNTGSGEGGREQRHQMGCCEVRRWMGIGDITRERYGVQPRVGRVGHRAVGAMRARGNHSYAVSGTSLCRAGREEVQNPES